MSNLNDILAKIAKARRDHTDAETAIFGLFISGGSRVTDAVPFIKALIDANDDLSSALTSLLADL